MRGSSRNIRKMPMGELQSWGKAVRTAMGEKKMVSGDDDDAVGWVEIVVLFFLFISSVLYIYIYIYIYIKSEFIKCIFASTLKLI